MSIRRVECLQQLKYIKCTCLKIDGQFGEQHHLERTMMCTTLHKALHPCTEGKNILLPKSAEVYQEVQEVAEVG